MTLSRPINTKGQTPKISQGFSSTHPGIDYAYPQGEAVHSAGDGKVVMVKSTETRQWLANTATDPFKPATGRRALTNADYGNMYKIDHGGNYSTLYAHLKHGTVLYKVGDTVKKGQKIAEVGSTGNSSGNHLHWEVRINDKTVDPAPLTDTTFTGYFTSSNESMSDLQACLTAHKKAVDDYAVLENEYKAKQAEWIATEKRLIDEKDKAIQQKDQTIANLNAELKSCLALKTSAESLKASYQATIKGLEEEVAKLETTIQKQVKSLDLQSESIVKLQNEIGEKDKDLLKAREDIVECLERPAPYKKMYESAIDELEALKEHIDKNYIPSAKIPLSRAIQRALYDIEHYVRR